MNPQLIIQAIGALGQISGGSGQDKSDPGFLRKTGGRSYTNMRPIDLNSLEDKAIKQISNQAGEPNETMNKFNQKQTPIWDRPLAPNQTMGTMYA